jgi:D-threo-aldose 1-dehydrogenase
MQGQIFPPTRGRAFTSLTGATLDFTALGFGCAPLGNFNRRLTNEEALSALQASWEQGIRYFDTAPLYGHGLAETRVGWFLREKPRDEFVLSTKVGRLLQRCNETEIDPGTRFIDVPLRRVQYDYSYDGVMRSIEASFERLGADKLDIALCHDIDVFTHGSVEASTRRTREFLDGGLRALSDLRAQGVLKAIGLGVNEWQVSETVARNSDLDLFLLAGRYTLLEQEALDSFLPLCERRGIGVIIGGPFNSGILATGPRPGARFNYQDAPEAVLTRVREIQAVCTSYDVPLRDAALQFPGLHPAVVSVVPGAVTPEEVLANSRSMDRVIPESMWRDLMARGLLRDDAPVGDVPSVPLRNTGLIHEN